MDSPELQTPSETEDEIIESFDVFSPYGLPQDSYPGPICTDSVGYNQKYATRVTSTPLTPKS